MNKYCNKLFCPWNIDIQMPKTISMASILRDGRGNPYIESKLK